MKNREQLKQELMERHKASLQAHLDKNISFFVENIDEENLFSVSKGDIYHPTKESIQKMFSNYLPYTNFSSYRDIQSPIIEVSDDGTLGWVVAKVHVAGTRKIDGKEVEFDNNWSWIMLYRRQNGVWLRTGDASTVQH